MTRGRHRAVAFALLVAGLLLAGGQLWPAAPARQLLSYRLPPASPPRELAVTFTPEGANEAERGARLQVPPGADSVAHDVSLPPGRYEVRVVLTAMGQPPLEVRRRVELTGRDTVVYLR